MDLVSIAAISAVAKSALVTKSTSVIFGIAKKIDAN
jgi:hypothetical protein